MWAPLAAAAVGAVGSVVSGVGQNASAKSAAAADEQNSDLALQQGQTEADAIREKARRVTGSNMASIGASGVDISGSFADAMDDSAINSELDAQTALWNSKVEASNYSSRSKQSRSSGTAALFGGVMGAGSEALSGYGNWQVLKAMRGAPASLVVGAGTGG